MGRELRRGVALCSVVLLLGVSQVQAQALSPSPGAAPDRRRCDAQHLSNCLNGVGGGVTSLDTLRINTLVPRARAEDEPEQRAKTLARSAAGDGMAAGNAGPGGFSVWGSGSRSDYSSDVLLAPYEGTTHNVLIGADRVFAERFVAGLTLGYEDTDTDTFYNGGGQRRTGFTVGGYGAYLVNDVFSVDAAAG